MGVSIHLKLSESITQKEWTPVYEKSRIIAEKSGFYDYGKKYTVRKFPAFSRQRKFAVATKPAGG